MLSISSTYHRLEPRLSAHATLALLPGTLTLLTAIAALFLAAGPAQGAPSVSPTTQLQITGAGYGHGVGMSQEGALGDAEHGWSYQQILAHYYSGSAIGQAPAGAVVRVLIGSRVHRVALENYVRGVVSAEVPASWPAAALQAQAIASRTYALTADAGGSRFDVYADTRSQMYRGVAAETPETNAAVAATAGQIITYEGHPVITYYFASSGGMTENVQNAFPGAEPEPWLRAVADPYDAGPLHKWRLAMSFAAAAAHLKGLVKGALRGIEVTKRGVSPRIVTAEVLGSAGDTRVSGPELAARLGLYDTWAYFSVRNGQSVVPEPDHSGQSATTIAPEAPAAPPVPAVGGPQGGAQAPSGSEANPAGGAAAG